MAGSDVVEAMRLALKPFNIQHLADDWNANRTYLQLSVQRCQHPLAAELWCWGVLASGSSVRLYRQLERFFFAGLRRPVVGKVLHMKWLEGELHGFHHVAARHCGDASRRT